MSINSMGITELVVRTIARTAVRSEAQFCQLDAVVGDGDFGYSLARGFEKVLADWDTFDRGDIGRFLKRIGIVIVSHAGGTSGPLWGTAFLRAGAAAGERSELSPAAVISLLRAAAAGIMERGGASLGDKTLLDALIPYIDQLEASVSATGALDDDALQRAAVVAELAAADTARLQAKRGRAAYTGDRSIGSPDAGAVAVAVIARDVSRVLQEQLFTATQNGLQAVRGDCDEEIR